MNMDLAADREKVARIVHGQISRRRREDANLHAILRMLESLCGEWALVGGAPRTWATNLPDEPRDLDIVVSAPRDLVEKALHCAIITSPVLRGATIGHTSLGGFRLEAGGNSYDIWAADTTLNVARGRVPFSNTFRAVAYSAPLSLDTLVVTSRGAVYERGFFNTLDSGVLTLRDASVMGATKLANKALRLCRTYNLIPDLILRALMERCLESAAVEALHARLIQTPPTTPLRISNEETNPTSRTSIAPHPASARDGVFVIHSREEARTYRRLAKLLTTAGLVDGREAAGQAPEVGPSQDFGRTVKRQIQTISTVVVLNTPKLLHNRWARHELDYARELGKRIVVLQPDGAFGQPIPRALHGGAFHVSSWSSDVLFRAVRGAHPYSGEGFDLRHIDQRGALAAIIANLDGVASVSVRDASASTLTALTDQLAARGVGLRWPDYMRYAPAGTTYLFAGMAGLLAASLGADLRVVGGATVLGAVIGAGIPSAKVVRARLEGPPPFQVLTLEAA